MPISLGRAVELLESIAPLQFAEDWDNVGLLLEPAAVADPASRRAAPVSRALLTIDLTEPVLAEALEQRVELIVAYHPPIFRGLERLTSDAPQERVLLGAARAGIAIYSPHTALDAAPGGVNDWLAAALGESDTAPIVPSLEGDALAPRPGSGMGRLVTLHEPAKLEDLVARIKAHLGLERVRVAAAPEHRDGAPIAKAAVCAGAGGALFEKLRGPALLLTGEMRHHDVLERVATGTSVVLCDHTNTERGYLPTLAERLAELAGGQLSASVSKRDRDPLQIV